MSNKKVWTITIVVAVVLLAAGIIYWRLAATPQAPTLEEAAQELGRAIEETTAVPTITTNPLGENLPEVNPVERANPFKAYQNPFQ